MNLSDIRNFKLYMLSKINAYNKSFLQIGVWFISSRLSAYEKTDLRERERESNIKKKYFVSYMVVLAMEVS